MIYIEILHLFSSWILQVGNQIFSFLFLLQTSENHLGTWNILFGVGQVDIQSFFAPNNTYSIEHKKKKLFEINEPDILSKIKLPLLILASV